MFRKFFLLGFICFFALNVYAIDSEEIFLKASDFYNNKRYIQALNLYQSIDSKGPVILYNIGNCKFELGKYFDALVYYNRAKKNASIDLLNSIYHNESVVNAKLGIHDHKVPKNVVFWQKFEDYVNLFLMSRLQVLFLIFWFLFLITCMFIKKFRAVFLIVNLACLIVSGLFVFVKHGLEKYPEAISKNIVNVYLGKSENYHKVLDLYVGQKVRVIARERVEFKKEYRDWFKIKYNGHTGWVLANNLEVI